MLTALAATAALLAGAPPLRDCDSRGEGGREPAVTHFPTDVIMGPMAFAGLQRVAEPDAFEHSRSRRGYVIKAGINLRAGTRATLSIGRAARGWAKLNYAPRNALTSSVRFRACAHDEPAFSYDGVVGIVTGFPGGFSLDRAGCVPLVVQVPGRAAIRKRVPFGVTRC